MRVEESRHERDLVFKYDATGNRILKIAISKGQNATIRATSYHRDAQGNVLSTEESDAVPTSTTSPIPTTREYTLYGSSRLGVFKTYALGTTPQEGDYYMTKTDKYYELTNHLGNVMAVLSDAKHYDHNAQHFTTHTSQAQDYMPFGMLMPGRKYTNTSLVEKYRYGFNGMENLDEVKGLGNTPDLGDRWHDPRLVRMNWKVDRRTAEYPWQSPYAYYGNSPIYQIDINGEGGPPNNRTAVDQNNQVARDNTAVIDLKADHDIRMIMPSDIEKAIKTAQLNQPSFNQGGILGTDEYLIYKYRLETAYEISKFAPVTGDIHDASSVVYHIGKGNFKGALGSAVFLIPFSDFAKVFKPIFKLNSPIMKGLSSEFKVLSKSHRISDVNITDAGTGKFAVIGQTMNRVKASAEFFSKTGSEIKTFHASKGAQAEWKRILDDYTGKVVPDNVIKGTQLYQENITWINKMKNQGYGFIDIGEDVGAGFQSTFYNMEKKQVYGK